MDWNTDLAVEAAEQLRSGTGELPDGVRTTRSQQEGYSTDLVEILSQEGAEHLGRPMGRYLTMELEPLLSREEDSFPRGVRAIAQGLRELLPALGPADPVLVVGLGNRQVTPDALGPAAAEHIMVTRHLVLGDRTRFGLFRPVAALAPGVLGTTGVESGELIKGVAERIRPKLVIAVDALAARSAERLCTTVQITDTGITPGSGVTRGRQALDQGTLGVPVIGMGIPTVVTAGRLAEELTGSRPGEHTLKKLLVTPKDIDSQIRDLSKLLGYGIDLALQDGLEVSDVELYLS